MHHAVQADQLLNHHHLEGGRTNIPDENCSSWVYSYACMPNLALIGDRERGYGHWSSIFQSVYQNNIISESTLWLAELCSG